MWGYHPVILHLSAEFAPEPIIVHFIQILHLSDSIAPASYPKYDLVSSCIRIPWPASGTSVLTDKRHGYCVRHSLTLLVSALNP
jgi:hypothetical protein